MAGGARSLKDGSWAIFIQKKPFYLDIRTKQKYFGTFLESDRLLLKEASRYSDTVTEYNANLILFFVFNLPINFYICHGDIF